MPNRRTVFFISDRTGITAEVLGNSLLSQFEGIEFQRLTIPFVDSVEKIDELRKSDKDLNRLLNKLTEQLGG